MKKRKILKMMAMTVIAMIFLVGCGSQEKEPQYSDQDYLNAMAQALEARWSIEEPASYGFGDDTHKEYFTEMVSTELEILNEYSNKVYEDSKLQEKVISYINCLKQQEEALSYMQVDYDKYYELWQEAYNERTKLIADFYDNYKIPISEEYISIINDIKTNAQLVENQDKTEKQVKEMLADIKFKKNKSESRNSYFTYEAIVENTTETNFEYFNLDMSLYDEDGIVVDTPYCGVETWKEGQKIKFTFGTSEKFDKYEINYAEWQEHK